MMPKDLLQIVREEREKSYTEFYSRFIEDHFLTDQEFINGVKYALDLGDKLHDAFESGNKLEIYQCAYLLKFGVHDACLGEEIFLKSAVKCDKLATFCSKHRINICCLGVRSLLAVLGVCKAIDEYVQKFKFSHEDDRTRVQIFMIDKNETWRVLSERIVNNAKKKYTAIKLTLDFLEKDIEKDYSETETKRIEKSHIVVMSKYLSNLNSEEIVAKLTKKTLKDMKKNAVLFYLDHDVRGDINELKKQLVKTNSFKEIKGSELPEKYVLQPSTKAYHKKSYDFLSPLNKRCFLINEPVTFSTYIKNPHVKIQNVAEKKTITATRTPCQDPEDPDKFYRPKKSSNTIRGSSETFRLVGKFALKDLEKKNKDDSSRQEAKKAAVSRYADFDDW